jgi:hypothetical protein
MRVAWGAAVIALAVVLVGNLAAAAESHWAASTDDRVCRRAGHPRGTSPYDFCRRNLARKRAESAPAKSRNNEGLLDQQDERVCRLQYGFEWLRCKDKRAAARRKGLARPLTKTEENRLSAEEERRRYFFFYDCYVMQQLSQDRYQLACGKGLTTTVVVQCTGVKCPEAEAEADRINKAKRDAEESERRARENDDRQRRAREENDRQQRAREDQERNRKAAEDAARRQLEEAERKRQEEERRKQQEEAQRKKI